ncbi:MAG: helix-turn-helix transcriptional regulator [Erythrobacter sp.]
MALKAHLGPIDRGSEGDSQRLGARRELLLQTSGVLPDGISENVTVHNISATGMLLQTAGSLVEGEELAIELPDLGLVVSKIVWVSGTLYGCAFDQSLSSAALAAIELRAGSPIAPSETYAAPTPSRPAETLGRKLNRLRKERSLTLAQVAAQLGVSKPTVWAWEKGKARPMPDRLDSIAQVLGVGSEELNSAAPSDDGAALVSDSRSRIAASFGVSIEKVRIMIEL